jgi:AraC-like DNA-binding protein
MVDFGQLAHDALPAVTGPPGVQTLTLAELTAQVPVESLRQPHRLDHHLLMLVTVGHGSHTVDFVRYRCRPGTLIWARPGQVVRYGAEQGFDATLVRWAADFLPPMRVAQAMVDDPFGPVWCQLAGEDEDAVINEVSQLAVDCQRRPDGASGSTDGGSSSSSAGPASGSAELSGEYGTELLRHQLATLVLRVAMLLPYETSPEPGHPAPLGPDGSEAAAFVRFRREIERSFGHTRRVEEYAARLGCSVRTLTRASLAATGRSAKQLIDDRVALEAKRLLAHTDQPVADIGRELGFPEPTNFGRFFAREVGFSPGHFRAKARN